MFLGNRITKYKVAERSLYKDAQRFLQS